MAETLYTIHEAAAYVNKSVQTIRRALKTKKLQAKKKKTPQGFNYLIKEESLLELYKNERQHGGINMEKSLRDAEQTSLVVEYASKEDFDEQKKTLNSLVDENRKDKETFMRFVKVFQDRFTALESQVKLLEEPAGSRRKWFQFWK
jgi:excisionase family DNA binding protein